MELTGKMEGEGDPSPGLLSRVIEAGVDLELNRLSTQQAHDRIDELEQAVRNLEQKLERGIESILERLGG